MKICLLARHIGLEGAGVGRVAEELYKRLVSRGHTVYKMEVKGDSLYEYFKFTALDTRLNLPRNYDVYHAISPMESILLPRDRSIVTFCDLFLLTHPDRTGAGLGQSRIKRWIGEQYWKFACHQAIKCRFITCISEQTKQHIKDYLGVGAQVIRPGISPSLVPQKKSDAIFRVGYLGQLDRRKRVDLLVKAFKDSYIQGELVIAGKGIDRAMLEKLADGDSRIKFLGFVPDDKLPQFYNSLSMLVSTTWLEGLGLPLIEAFACRKPVVVLEDAVIPEEIKSRCVVTNNLTNFLNVLPICRFEKVQENQEFAESFNWGNFVTEHEKLYKEISCS